MGNETVSIPRGPKLLAEEPFQSACSSLHQRVEEGFTSLGICAAGITDPPPEVERSAVQPRPWLSRLQAHPAVGFPTACFHPTAPPAKSSWPFHRPLAPTSLGARCKHQAGFSQAGMEAPGLPFGLGTRGVSPVVRSRESKGQHAREDRLALNCRACHLHAGRSGRHGRFEQQPNR